MSKACSRRLQQARIMARIMARIRFICRPKVLYRDAFLGVPNSASAPRALEAIGMRLVGPTSSGSTLSGDV